MANQTVTTTVNFDDASISGLLNGETITINGGSVTLNADNRHNQQAAVLGPVILSSALGGSFFIDGTQIWEVPFSASTGNVPTQGALGTNAVTGGTSGATGELTRVWATGSLAPAAAAAAMPATGFIKLRSRTGNFEAGETITLPGGATVTASSAGKRSWLHVAGRESTVITIPRLGNCEITGDWYDLAVTNGLDDQTIQFPVADECPALQVETAPGSGVYEWWLNAGRRWVGHVQVSPQGVNGVVETANIATRPSFSDPVGFLHTPRLIRETATTAVHQTGMSIGATGVEAGIHTLRTYVKKETRRYGFAQITSGVGNADRYGVIIDFDAAGAVVATPTVGSPLNTSNTVTALSGGWYLIELTINVVSASASTLSAFVGPSNSDTPTLVNGQPSYAGATTEGMWYTELQLVAPSSIQYVNSTDERGKYYFSNPQTGVITFAQRTGLTAGFKPASGLKIRIPNVILSNAPAIDYTINSVQTPGFTFRYGFSTAAAGAVSISHAVMNWYQAIASAFTVSIQNCALTAWNSSAAASTQVYSNLGIGISRDHSAAGFLALSNAQSGITLTDIRQVRDQNGSGGIFLSACAKITGARCRVEAFGFSQGRTVRNGTVGTGFSVTNCADVVFDDSTVVGTAFSVTSTTNFQILNTKYAERITGQTESLDAGTAINISTACFDGMVDGFSLIPGIANVHPYTAIVQIATNCSRIEIRNIGTPAAPLNGGSANPMRNVLRFVGTVFNSAARRIYTENLFANAVFHNATNQNIRLYNVWGDGADALTSVTGFDVLAQGCRWSNNNGVQSAVYGVHWEDAFTGSTSGRITIFGNEPLTSTIDQCAASFGINAGFTSAGNASMPNLGDSITWTMPYYALGHTGIAQFGYGASTTETWLFTGTNAQNFEFEYQIDTGSGSFSAWKWMLDIARQASGGLTGTNTITINAADIAAMTRMPQAGDYIQSTNARLPAGTTITSVTGAGNNVLTLSANFTSAMSGSELVFFWNDIALETISPATGYKLKVKARVNLANVNNLFSFLRIPFDTNSTDQQIQYPLPGSLLTVNGLVAGSRVKVSRVDTGAFLAQTQALGSTASFDIPYTGAVQVEARNASSSPSYKPWLSVVNISSSSPVVITALQEAD